MELHIIYGTYSGVLRARGLFICQRGVVISEKTFKTYDELIDILTERGISISTPDERDYAKTF